jgi:hypothetical protein
VNAHPNPKVDIVRPPLTEQPTLTLHTGMDRVSRTSKGDKE